jgi:hypothetical protein
VTYISVHELAELVNVAMPLQPRTAAKAKCYHARRPSPRSQFSKAC